MQKKTFATTTTTALEPVKVMITAVNAGVPTLGQVIAGGIYNVPLGSGVSQASTTGSGSGAIFTFDWKAYAYGGHVGVDPEWNNQAFTGQKAIQVVRNGIRPDGTINWSVLVPSGGIYESDLMPCDIPVGGAIGLRACFGWGANVYTGRRPIGTTYGATTTIEEAYNGNSWYDESYQTTITAGTAFYILQPAAIMGIPKIKMPSIVAIGDSRTIGNASGIDSISGCDKVSDDGACGPFERALSESMDKCIYPWANFSRGGVALDHYFNNGITSNRYGGQHLFELLSIIKPTAVYLNLNYNDIGTASPYATVKTREQQFIAQIRGCGVKYVFTSTTEPGSTSTDSFATLENQTPIAYAAVVAQRNNELIAGTYADYDFVVDNRLVSESSINSGKWKVNGTANWATGDGVHASPYIIELQADGIADAIKANISL